MNKKHTHLVIVKADTNDADYVEQSTFLNLSNSNDLEALELVRKVSKVLGETKGKFEYNWPENGYVNGDSYEQYSDYLTEDEINAFSSAFVPNSENGVHSICNIKIVEVSNVEVLYSEYQ
jgi:hypothetical protein